MEKNIKIAGGIFLVLGGFYMLMQILGNLRFVGLAVVGVGLYWILSSLN